jgi:hypothetical protein
MAGMTNRGKYWALDWVFRGATLPTNMYIALCTSAATPDADTNTFVELTQIATGNGYTDGGYSLTLNGTDFDDLQQDDANDRADMQLKDITWSASSGSIPDSGDGARWAVLTDDNGTQDNRIVIGFWNLTTDRSVSDGQDLTLVDLELRLQEPA